MKKIPHGYYATIFYERASKTHGVRFIDHPGVITYGATLDKAADRAKEALSLALQSDFDREQPLPVSRKPKGKRAEKIVFIPIDPDIRTAYLLRQWREHARLTQQALAKRLGISFQAYQRMERPGRSNLTVATLERIAHALDKNLVLGISSKRAA